MHHFSHVQQLELCEGCDALIDLRLLTLLTRLCIQDDVERKIATVIMPDGEDVQLQSLEVLTYCGPEPPYQILNLDKALQLSSIHMDCPEALQGMCGLRPYHASIIWSLPTLSAPHHYSSCCIPNCGVLTYLI